MYHLSRRTVLQQLSWASMGFLLACNSSTLKSERPIRVGAMYLLTGGFATYGEFARDGINLALAEIERAGGINGKPLEVIFEDESDPVQKVGLFHSRARSCKLKFGR